MTFCYDDFSPQIYSSLWVVHNRCNSSNSVIADRGQLSLTVKGIFIGHCKSMYYLHLASPDSVLTNTISYSLLFRFFPKILCTSTSNGSLESNLNTLFKKLIQKYEMPQMVTSLAWQVKEHTKWNLEKSY